MEDLLHRGWAAHGARSFVHYCGAKVIQHGKQSWTAKKVDGALSFGYESAEQATRWIEVYDTEFWSYGSWASGGVMTDDIAFTAGFLDTREVKELNDRDHVVVLYLYRKRKFPRQNESSFKKLFLSNARCAKCDRQSTEIVLRSLPQEGGQTEHRAPHIVCICGYPVWRISWDAWSKASHGVRDAEYWREKQELRKISLRAAGGKHNVREIQEILSYQENRCIYCNVRFDNGVQATRDHLVPVIFGGTDWALNIVMACRSCNTHRGTIPFRTYCTILSPTQNRRILNSMGRRIASIELDELRDEAFSAFCKGIARKNSRHKDYQRILRKSATARRNAAINELLPSAPHLILTRANAL